MTSELRRVKNWDGDVPWTWDGVSLSVLVEIRDELRKLNNVFQCSNVQRGFSALRQLSRQNELAFQRRVKRATKKLLARKAKP